MIFLGRDGYFFLHRVMKVIYDQPHKSRPPTSWGLCLTVPMYISYKISSLFHSNTAMTKAWRDGCYMV